MTEITAETGLGIISALRHRKKRRVSRFSRLPSGDSKRRTAIAASTKTLQALGFRVSRIGYREWLISKQCGTAAMVALANTIKPKQGEQS